MRDNFSIIAKGAIYTLGLAVGADVIAVILALFGALGRLSKNPVAFGISGFYTSFFRGTPLIVELFLFYVALPQIGASLGSRSLLDVLTLSASQAGVIGLGLNYGAYITKNFRADTSSSNTARPRPPTPWGCHTRSGCGVSSCPRRRASSSRPPATTSSR